jgi:hypothetical protein
VSRINIIENGDAKGVISILSIGEVNAGALKKGLPIAKEVRDYLINFPNCRCQELTMEVLEKVGNDERVDWKGLRTADSLVVASGLVSNVDKCLQKSMLLSSDEQTH